MSVTRNFVLAFVIGFATPQVFAQTFCDGADLASCPCVNPGNPSSGCDNAQSTGGVLATVRPVCWIQPEQRRQNPLSNATPERGPARPRSRARRRRPVMEGVAGTKTRSGCRSLGELARRG